MSNSSPRRGVTGTHTQQGRPLGYSSLTPFIVSPDPGAAIRFYQDVFGARARGVVEMPVDGTSVVVHAELDFGAGILQLGAPNPAYGLVLPPGEGTVCYSMGVYVSDVDEAVEKAVERGATVREAPTDFVSGDRYASVLDPFGIRWSVMTRVEDLSPEESEARVAAWAKQT